MFTASVKTMGKWRPATIPQDPHGIFSWIYQRDGTDAVVCKETEKEKIYYSGNTTTLEAYRKADKQAATFDDLARKLIANQ